MNLTASRNEIDPLLVVVGIVHPMTFVAWVECHEWVYC
jgi:hypothetical protein